MREIKFKYYSIGVESKKVRSEIFTLDKIESYSREGIWNFAESMFENLVVYRKQYTGLKDKNDVDIYADDLLRDDENRIFKVILDERIGATGYMMECVKNKSEKDHIHIGNIYNFYSWLTPFHYLKVIGNIYENKELLND